jgi:hypothetical protein
MLAKLSYQTIVLTMVAIIRHFSIPWPINEAGIIFAFTTKALLARRGSGVLVAANLFFCPS